MSQANLDQTSDSSIKETFHRINRHKHGSLNDPAADNSWPNSMAMTRRRWSITGRKSGYVGRSSVRGSCLSAWWIGGSNSINNAAMTNITMATSLRSNVTSCVQFYFFLATSEPDLVILTGKVTYPFLASMSLFHYWNSNFFFVCVPVFDQVGGWPCGAIWWYKGQSQDRISHLVHVILRYSQNQSLTSLIK